MLSNLCFGKGEEGDESYSRKHMGYGMMGPGMGMMRHGDRRMMEMCPFSEFSNTNVSFEETKTGGVITYSAKEKKDIDRIHKILQMAKLSKELHEEDQTK